MNILDNNPELLHRLADIEMPTAPDLPGLFLSVVIAGAFTTCALVYWFMRKRKIRRSPQKHNYCTYEEAISRLDDIHHQWKSGSLNQRDTAFQIATLLRLAFNLPQLYSAQPHILNNLQVEWQSTINCLSSLRYPKKPCTTLSESIFTDIREWLEKAEHQRKNHV
ncbi:MAG: hypothetical protein ACE5EH_06370 [Gammaproteobacteria bacterium]